MLLARCGNTADLTEIVSIPTWQVLSPLQGLNGFTNGFVVLLCLVLL